MAKKTAGGERSAEHARIIAYILKSTNKWAAKEFAGGKTEVSEKAKNIGKALEASKGISEVDKKELSKAFGYAIGETIPFEGEDKLDPPNMVALVLTGAFSNHAYPIGEIVLHSTAGQGIMPNGEPGNWLQPPRKYVRPATPEEIEAISDTQLEGLMREATIVLA